VLRDDGGTYLEISLQSTNVGSTNVGARMQAECRRSSGSKRCKGISGRPSSCTYYYGSAHILHGFGPLGAGVLRSPPRPGVAFDSEIPPGPHQAEALFGRRCPAVQQGVYVRLQSAHVRFNSIATSTQYRLRCRKMTLHLAVQQQCFSLIMAPSPPRPQRWRRTTAIFPRPSFLPSTLNRR
jgi:hypothetical protein